MPRLRVKADPYERYVGMILARMKLCGYTQEDLASRLDVTRNTVQRYLKTPGVMQMDTVRRLNRILGLKAEDVRQALPMW